MVVSGMGTGSVALLGADARRFCCCGAAGDGGWDGCKWDTATIFFARYAVPYVTLFYIIA